MGEAQAWAEDERASELRLSVWSFNESARALYERLGFGARYVSMAKPVGG